MLMVYIKMVTMLMKPTVLASFLLPWHKLQSFGKKESQLRKCLPEAGL